MSKIKIIFTTSPLTTKKKKKKKCPSDFMTLWAVIPTGFQNQKCLEATTATTQVFSFPGSCLGTNT